MTRRYLFGPVSTSFAEQHLWQHWPGESCKVFDVAPDGTQARSATTYCMR